MESLANFPWLSVIEAVFVIAVAIAAATPTEKDDNVVARLRGIFRTWTGRGS
jgi:hypothetical protein